MWHLGKNLLIGDSYTYKIYDPNAIMNYYSSENYNYFTQNKEHNSSLCYLVKLDFVNPLSSDKNQNYNVSKDNTQLIYYFHSAVIVEGT